MASEINAAERSLFFFQHGHSGSFDMALWNAFACADLTNQHLLAKGFPEHAEAWRKYSTVPGWWPALEARIGKGE